MEEIQWATYIPPQESCTDQCSELRDNQTTNCKMTNEMVCVASQQKIHLSSENSNITPTTSGNRDITPTCYHRSSGIVSEGKVRSTKLIQKLAQAAWYCRPPYDNFGRETDTSHGCQSTSSRHKPHVRSRDSTSSAFSAADAKSIVRLVACKQSTAMTLSPSDTSFICTLLF